MFFEWIFGVAFRPGATFERAREHLRFGYWWIFLTVVTLESVVGTYGVNGYGTDVWADGALFMMLQMLILFDIQALMLMGAARLTAKWQLNWIDAHKFTGLLWSILVIEDLATFYYGLHGLEQVTLWAGAFFSLWYVVVMFIGLRRFAGLTAIKALFMTLLAGVVWRGGILAIIWSQTVSR